MSTIFYIAAARVADHCCFAQHVVPCSNHTAAAVFEQKLQKILLSPQLKHNNRLTIVDDHQRHIHYEADPALIFLVVTAASYPQRTAFELLSAARTDFDQLFAPEMGKATPGALSKRARPVLERLVQHYHHVPNLDKISNVQHQVEQVKGMMQHNIQSALHNTDNLETLLDISDNMKNEAYSFNRSTAQVKNRMQWKDFQMKLLIAFLVLLIVSIVIASVVVHRKGQQQA